MELPWTLISGWLNPEESKKWKLKIYKTLKWDQPIVKVFGKKYLVPRKTVFLGEHNIQYSYSGVIHRSNGWPIWFYPLVSKLSVMNNCNFNGCLINLYRNGNDKMGWHADNEKELNPNKPICSISLGASRDFYLKNCSTNKKTVFKEMCVCESAPSQSQA